jgi:Las17-binding protein actin regulator
MGKENRPRFRGPHTIDDAASSFGCFGINRDTVNPFREEEISFLHLIGRVVAFALDDGLNLRRSQQHNERLKLLLNLTSRITSNLKFRELLREIAANIREVIQADAAGIAFYDAASAKSRIYVVDFPNARGFVKEEILVTPGEMICRSGAHYTGPWGAPALYALEGINIGFQLGGQATDFVLLVMNPKGAESLLTSKVKLGADASAAAGPKGRTAEAATDVVMKAEVLSYSRSKGLFAGISLEGSTLRSDGSSNQKLYGQELSAKDIIRGGKVKAPPAAHDLIALLNKKTPKNKSDPKSLQ